ncbi:MAG: HAD family acid phosphatase [Nannocystaceae bacterium]
MLRRPLAPLPALALAVVVASGCRREAEDTAPPCAEAPAPAPTPTPAAADEASASADAPGCRTTPGLGAIVWTQTSAEFAANSVGAFAQATLALDRALKDKKTSAADEQQGSFAKLPPAVILDIDETVLDNSPYQAWLTREGKTFELPTWAAWVAAAKAEAVPGALAFTQAAAAKGVTVFYVSNRDVAGEAATRDNLARLGFPLRDAAEVDVVLLQNERPEWSSAKGTRRAAVAERYRIVMLVGDNLGDFTDQYKGSVDERAKVVDTHRERWGSRWIMIANPMYGAWESAASAPKADAAASAPPIPAAVVTWEGPG